MKNRGYGKDMCNTYEIEGQYYFEQNLFANFMAVVKKHNLVYKSHLDFGCGLGYFCDLMNKNGVLSFGVDLSSDMVSMATQKFGNQYFLGDICNFKLDAIVDLVTCNHNTINHIDSIDKWKMFFENAYCNLNKGGYLLFDFNTLNFINSVNHFSYSHQNSNLDVFKSVLPNNDYQLQFRYITYTKQSNGYYSKNIESILITCFEVSDIFRLITECGFKIKTIWDNQFCECTMDSNTIRIYVLARKE